MKKSLLLTLAFSILTLLGCQNDDISIPENQSVNENITLKGSGKTTSLDNQVFELPEKYLSNPLEYIKMQPEYSSQKAIAPQKITYGCVTFDNGVAHIDCPSITSGIPKVFRDCDIQVVRYLECGVLDVRPDCIVCAVLFVAECDGKLYWTIGYDIICE